MSRVFWAKGRGADFQQRILGCAILFALPIEALAEALSSLEGIWEFHAECRQHQLPAPPVEHRSVGTIIRAELRPELVIAE